MADKLTPQQHQAVHDRGGQMLVSAAAGSGKTKVLVDRLMTYLTDENQPANLDEFLIITYTKAAAAELRGKIAAKLTERIAQEPQNRHLQKQMQRLFLTKISTVHGFCSDILREYAYRLDLPADFRVADENECREIRELVLTDLLDRVYENAGENSDLRAFLDTQRLGRDDRLVPQIVEQVYDSARCHLDPDWWLEDCRNRAAIDDVCDPLQTPWGRYLYEDLMDYLDCQIHVFRQCCDQTEIYPELEKVTINLNLTLERLQSLRGACNWDEIVKMRNIDYGRLVFPKKNPDPDLGERIKAARTACKDGLKRKLHSFSDESGQVLKDLSQVQAGTRGLIELVRQFDRDYSVAKRNRRCLDFSDLEQKTLDLLLGKSRSGTTAAGREIGNRFREIMVDEYQDSNGVQDAIFTALTEGRQNSFLVGDVKQSIYQFRLADPGIFLEKYHGFVTAEEASPGQGRKVLLSHNFRSGPEIIEAVNHVFAACMRPHVGGLRYTESEALREGIPQEPFPDSAVELYAVDVREEIYPEEAAFVAQKIQTMLREGTLVRKNGALKPVEPEDIVILLRSPGSAAGYFQRALEAKGIRCSTGGGTDLLQTQEIGTLRSFLEVIVNPRQDIPLISTLASPIFGFTADDLAKIRSKCKHGAFFDALMLDSGEKAGDFLKILDILRQESRFSPLTGLLETCFALTHLDSIYGAMAEGAVKSANLQAFYQLAADFEKGNLRDLSQFLEHLKALESRGVVSSAGNTSGCVTIMSIHKSKGLEFPVVFLCNLSRKFNQENLRAQILCDKALGLGLSVADPKNRIRYPSVAKRAIAVKMAAESVSEEMRVLYVAMTRARDRLIMSYASRTLAADLQEQALRQDFDDGELLCRDAISMGEWILLAALRKTEAGRLQELGGRPHETKIGVYPWKIDVVTAPEDTGIIMDTQRKNDALREEQLEQLKKGLSFRYAHRAATLAPSKQTATGLKGRIKDEEARENTREPRKITRTWRKPVFETVQHEGRVYGNALHAAMQHLKYENCGDVEQVRMEIRRLVQQGFLTEEQASMVSSEKIAGFFQTEEGKKLRSGTPHLREFKFSILDGGERYAEGLESERVLLQGVVDCALLEEDGITVLDFKTDRVTADTLESVAEHYQPQVQVYADALSRIYEMPVKRKLLYFFRLERFVEIK